MTHLKRCTALQLTAAALLASTAVSATADPELELENIIVTARREPGNLLVTGDQLRTIQAKSLEDIFAFESSVAVEVVPRWHRKSMCAASRTCCST